MATNLALDPDLLERAYRVSGATTKKAAVTRALTEAGEQVFEIGEVRTRQPGEAAAVVA